MKNKLDKYAKLLTEWQERLNLVAPSTLPDIETRHFRDSAQLARILPADDIIDLGSGGGFPGVVLAIMGFNVTCVESIGKKVMFLEALKKELNLSNLNVIRDRVENVVKKLRTTDKNKTYIFTARAFAPLIKILDYVSPLKSRLFLLKGREFESEIIAAKQKYDFNYKLYPSETGDGFMADISNIHLKKR